MTEVVFETHSLSEDNEAGIASGWSHSRLSVRGRELARQLGERRRSDGIAAVFASDLRRAAETAHIAFAETTIPVFLDWRLRECDFGECNAGPADRHVRDRQDFLDVPYPGGESWRQAVARVGCFLGDLPTPLEGDQTADHRPRGHSLGVRTSPCGQAPRGSDQRRLPLEGRVGIHPRRPAAA